MFSRDLVGLLADTVAPGKTDAKKKQKECSEHAGVNYKICAKGWRVRFRSVLETFSMKGNLRAN